MFVTIKKCLCEHCEIEIKDTAEHWVFFNVNTGYLSIYDFCDFDCIHRWLENRQRKIMEEVMKNEQHNTPR